MVEQKINDIKMAIFISPEEVPAVCEMLWSHYLESMEGSDEGKRAPLESRKKAHGFRVKMSVRHLNYFLHYPQRIARAVRFAKALGVSWHVGVPHVNRDVELSFSLSD